MKLALCTPVYGGQSMAIYENSVRAFEKAATAQGIEVTRFQTADSLVQRARNTITRDVLATDHEWLLWIDSDIGFPPAVPLAMLATGLPIIAAPYAKKSYHWDNIGRAARMNDGHLETCGTFPVCNFWPEPQTIDALNTISVLDAGTGFLLTHRGVYEEMAVAMRDEMLHKAGAHRVNEAGEVVEEDVPCFAFWHCQIDGAGHYLSEDWLFCRRAQSLGFDVRMYVTDQLVHVGPHPFRCDLRRIIPNALPGASPNRDDVVEIHEIAA